MTLELIQYESNNRRVEIKKALKEGKKHLQDMKTLELSKRTKTVELIIE